MVGRCASGAAPVEVLGEALKGPRGGPPGGPTGGGGFDGSIGGPSGGGGVATMRGFYPRPRTRTLWVEGTFRCLQRSAFCVDLSQESLQVEVADRHALHGVALRLVLLHHQPFRAGVATSVQDVGPIQVAFSDLRVDRPAANDNHVLEMDERRPALEPPYPGGWVRAAVLQPVGIELGEKRFGRGGRKERLEGRLGAVSLQLVAVIVIGQPQSEGAKPRGDLHRLGRKPPVPLLGSVLVREAGHDHVPGAPLLALSAHAIEVGDKALERHVNATSDHVVSDELSPKALRSRRTETRDLDRSVTDLPQPAQHAADSRGIPQLLPDGVQLDSDHRAATSAVSNGSKGGRRQVLDTSTCRALAADSRIESITSRAWYASSPDRRACSPFGMAAAIAPRPLKSFDASVCL